MAGDNGWDLYAVVRSCNSAIASTSAAASTSNQYATPIDTTAREDALSCLASLSFEEERNDDAFSFANMFEPKQPNGFQELQQAYMSFFPKPAASVSTTTVSAGDISNPPSSDFGPSSSQNSAVQNRHSRQAITPVKPQSDLGPPTSSSPSLHERPQPQKHHQPPAAPFQRNFPTSPMTQSHTPKSRKRKSQQKRTICHVPADNLSTDMWAWRKYGQKPIKGSPYPRNYYRCSSSKGCAARKQVERSNADPDNFIVTYTGDHTHPRPTHRNSLAGSSRNKLISMKNTASGDPNPSSRTTMADSCLSPASPTTPPISQNEDEGVKETSNGDKEGEVLEDMAAESGDEEEEEDILIPNLAMRDEIFVGLEDLGYSPKQRS